MSTPPIQAELDLLQTLYGRRIHGVQFDSTGSVWLNLTLDDGRVIQIRAIDAGSYEEPCLAIDDETPSAG